MVNALLSLILFCSSGSSVSLGKKRFIVVGRLMVVVKMKKVSSKKPKSTMGVKSTLVDIFLLFFDAGPFFIYRCRRRYPILP
jgi:hypothetical protein